MGPPLGQHPTVHPYLTLNVEKLHQIIPSLQRLVLIRDATFLPLDQQRATALD